MIIILYIKVKNLKESNEKIISNVRKNKINIDKYLENSSELLDWKKIFDYLIELNWVERTVTVKNNLQVLQNLHVTGNVTANKDIHAKNDLYINHNLNVNDNFNVEGDIILLGEVIKLEGQDYIDHIDKLFSIVSIDSVETTNNNLSVFKIKMKYKQVFTINLLLINDKLIMDEPKNKNLLNMTKRKEFMVYILSKISK